MRNSSSWIEPLRRQIGEAIPLKFSNFARIELMLYALRTYFPRQQIDKAHLLVQGYREPGINDHQWKIIQHLRHLAPEFRSSISWEIALRNYDELINSVPGWLGFEIDYDSNHITLTNNMVTSRYGIYENALNKPLQFDLKRYNPTPEGNYQFKINSQDIRLVSISNAIANIGQQHKANIPHINLSYDRQPIQISLDRLIERGRQLHPILGYDAGEMIGRSSYWDVQQNRSTDEILIEGASHILGPTGSGKSTLIECLITLLVEENKRIAIATNSVGEVQEWLEFAQKVGIKAVPIIGSSERHKHLSRLNQAVMFGNKHQSFTHPGFPWLSQSCPLFAIATPQVSQSTSQKRNKTPCFGQLEDTDDSKKKKYDCPLVAVCPQHIKASDVDEAQLIIGTLPGFIHKKVSRHDLQENITILEYLALTTDVFVVDEVDLAQPKLDELFYPIVTIESFNLTQDTWTRSESSQHANGFLEGAAVVPTRYRDSYLEQSEDWRRLAFKAFSALMYSLRDITSCVD